MSKIALVTGGSGFVGGRLIERLVANGWSVRALARSPQSRKAVIERGAEAFEGDLSDATSISIAMAGCTTVFHIAALFKLWGKPEEFEQVNVDGTRLLVDVAKVSGTVRRFIQLGAAAVVMGDMTPIISADETLPTYERNWAAYSASKARSEAIVLGANRSGLFETLVIRPPMIWGKGMPTLGHMVKQVQSSQFRWVGDGMQGMSIAHVDNVCQAVELAVEHGQGGQAYFVSDERDTTLKQFISDLLKTQQVNPPKASVPLPIAWFMAGRMEWVWRTFKLSGEPPITRQMLRLIGTTFTLDISKAKHELGYTPVVTYEQGLTAMQSNK